MLRLIDRNRQIPGGLKFFQPETKWEPAPWSSFSTIVDGLINHRRANPYLATTNKWAMDRRAVEDEVDAYNASICAAHGWTNFIGDDGKGAVPKPWSPLQGAGRLVAGANVLLDMFGPEGPIRESNIAESRAAICVKRADGSSCPKHDTGDWTRFFTKPAQALVIKALGIVKDQDLKTSHDDALKICTACGCPMRAKVWARLKHILAHIPASDKADLDESCWILAEERTLNATRDTKSSITSNANVKT